MIKIQTTKDFKEQRLHEGYKVGVVNLGCARNLVDSQTILGRLKKSGHRIVDMKDAGCFQTWRTRRRLSDHSPVWAEVRLKRAER